MTDEAGDETIADVLERVGALKKDDMTTEVEAYGLEVHSSWTKDDIMDNFEQFLLGQADGDEEPADEEPADDTISGVPPLEDAPPAEFSEAALVNQANEVQEEPEVPVEAVRIARSRAWGQTTGVHAP